MTDEHVVASIDRHFAERLGTRAEAEMRAHLPRCASCRARYERHLLYGRLSRNARPAQARLARGLGLRVAAAPRAAWPRWTAAALATAVAVVALIVLGGGRSVDPSGRELAARGGAAAARPVLFVYRMVPGGAPVLAADRLSRNDELAFAYGNPAAQKYLWIFAVDEHRHVYWYYPAWPSGTPAPGPLAAQPGAGPHELPDAVRHRLDGARVELHALVADQPIAVTDIEAQIAAGGTVAFPGAADVHRTFEVEP
jgi:hypothetical protein